MISHFRISGGICDCRDGSDEYDGQVRCRSTCCKAGKVAGDQLKKKITTYKEWVALRKQDVEQAKQAIAKDEAELLKLKDEEKILKSLVQQLRGASVDSSKLEGFTVTGVKQHAVEDSKDSVSPQSKDDSAVVSDATNDGGSEPSHGQA